jgi:hypothetical protein
MYTRRWYLGLFLSLGLLGAQGPPAAIQVTGAVKQPLTLTADELAKMPRASVKTTANGMEALYEGVWLHEALKRAGVPQGSALRGKALFGAQGRFRLVAPKDKPGARSVRMLTKLEVVQLRK